MKLLLTALLGTFVGIAVVVAIYAAGRCDWHADPTQTETYTACLDEMHEVTARSLDYLGSANRERPSGREILDQTADAIGELPRDLRDLSSQALDGVEKMIHKARLWAARQLKLLG